ncbi:hypothetical protein [Herpetosiphon llansteffanensis]|uniref:hypothetical protein n=1 Tax=Herpetosiphon llansteffanensis TaxID=2094568 RepID=UPI000D7C541E|nr:hypothetical protein [Herpetosiphon llansteffanensis]
MTTIPMTITLTETLALPNNGQHTVQITLSPPSMQPHDLAPLLQQATMTLFQQLDAALIRVQQPPRYLCGALCSVLVCPFLGLYLRVPQSTPLETLLAETVVDANGQSHQLWTVALMAVPPALVLPHIPVFIHAFSTPRAPSWWEYKGDGDGVLAKRLADWQRPVPPEPVRTDEYWLSGL